MTVLRAAAGLGVVVVLAMLGCQRWLLAGAGFEPSDLELPPVSVLKPLKGVDADLEANLLSFLRLDYPDYELVLGVEDPDDPVLAVARRVAGLDRRVRIVVDGREVGHNPKVKNLANLLAYALLPALAAAALDPGRITLSLLASVALVAAAAAAVSERMLGVPRRRPLYLVLEPLRALMLAVLWPLPFLSSTVEWRGRTYGIGPRTLLEPVGGGHGFTPALVEAEEHAAA